MPRARVPARPQPDADSAWKRVLQALLPDFLALAHPALHTAIDWSHPPAFLDKESQAVTRQGRKGRRAVDLLASVRRIDGGERWGLVHVEVQADKQAEFARRMFVYHARLVDRYDRPVVSMAILSDDQASWRQAAYAHDYWGCAVSFRYPALMLLERRCGALPDDVTRQVRGLSTDALGALALALSGFSDPADLDAWLAAHPAAARYPPGRRAPMSRRPVTVLPFFAPKQPPEAPFLLTRWHVSPIIEHTFYGGGRPAAVARDQER